ncbi:adenylyl-sulfate kinase [Aquipuribacter hungaricus]|uniref:Adenylyl-sulfate kinase n=1 Tax=Aquipuribacter hungaricus TaxID=545624 RepID=A0ABV7WER5_9MICO
MDQAPGDDVDLVPAVHDRVVALLAVRRPVLVCLDGRSGSGKTTLARRLVRRLRDGGATVTVLHLDSVYPGWDGLAAAVRLVGEELLPALREGREPAYPAWSWVRDRPGPDVTVRQADVVLVEGVGSGSRAGRRAADLLVWLEAPAAVRHGRAMARDGDSYRPHWERWAAQEEAYVRAERPAAAADLVLATAPGAVLSAGGPSLDA